MITLGIPAYRKYDLLELCIQSSLKGSVKPDKIFIVDNGGKYVKKDYGVELEVYTPGYNSGCAKAWNYIMDHSTDIVILSNDDIQFAFNTIEEIQKNFCENKIIYPILPTQNIFSCFSISKDMWETLDKFDEEFLVYFEDNSFYRKIILTEGFSFFQVPSRCEHVGSATLKSYNRNEEEAHHRMFRRMRAIYTAMWGGIPGSELFTKKWNGADPKPILERINKASY